MDVREQVAEVDPNALLADGFDDCVIGVTDSWSGHARPTRVVYSADKIIDKLMAEDGCTYEQAAEHFDFNIAGGYHGEHTPIFVRSLED
jgi:hypothetical protein